MKLLCLCLSGRYREVTSNRDSWRILVQALLSTASESQRIVCYYNPHLHPGTTIIGWYIGWYIYNGAPYCTILVVVMVRNVKQSIQPKNYKHPSNPCHLLLPLPSSISASRLRFNSAILMISFLLSIPYLSYPYICHCISLGLRKGGKLGVFKGWNEWDRKSVV